MEKIKYGIFGLVLCAGVWISGCSPNSGGNLGNMDYEVNLEDDLQKLSYALGVNIGKNLQQQGLDSMSKEAFIQALNDVKNGSTKLTDQECGQVLQEGFKKISEEKSAKTKAEGEAYLAENGKKPGVTTLPSGLQYEVMKEGGGPTPTAEDKVKVHYHGTLLDGTVFDSSVDRDQPTTFGVTQVIRGWTEALQLMPVGSKWKLTIPSDLAYGERGAGPQIGPHSTLIFEVELLGIEEQKPEDPS